MVKIPCPHCGKDIELEVKKVEQIPAAKKATKKAPKKPEKKPVAKKAVAKKKK